jgi:hypothetical protein
VAFLLAAFVRRSRDRIIVSCEAEDEARGCLNVSLANGGGVKAISLAVRYIYKKRKPPWCNQSGFFV